MASTKSKRPARAKATKVQIRLQPEEKALIGRAAEARRTTLSHFLLEHAFQAAQQVLAEQNHFVLSPDRWKAFCRALDRSPRRIPALRKLLTEKDAFDGAGPRTAR